MLNKQVFDVAVPYATAFADDALTLSPEPSSLLSMLVASAVPPLKHNENLTLDSYIENVALTISGSTPGELTPYERNIDSYSLDVAKFVSEHIKYVRNNIQPLLKDTVEFINEFTSLYSERFNENAFDVVKCSVPSPLYLDVLASDIEQTNPYRGQNYKLFKTLSPIDEDMVLELLLTGNSNVDREIKNWLVDLTPKWAMNIHNVYFANNNCMSAKLLYGNPPALPGLANLDVLLAVYLMGVKYLVNPPQDLNISSVDFESQIRQIINWSAGLIKNELRLLKSKENLGMVVLTIDRRDCKIYVHEPSFTKYLTEGGCIESVLGVAVSESGHRTIAAMSEHKKDLINEWSLYQTTSQEQIRINYVKELKHVLLNHFHRSMLEPDAVELEYLTANPEFKNEALNKAEQYINGLGSECFKDPVKIAYHLLAEIRFSYNTSSKILGFMLEIERINPDIDPKEAALMAVVSYVTEYMVSQIVIKR